jgi:hypothetical protein
LAASWGKALSGDEPLKPAISTIILRSRSLIGDLLWLTTIGFVFAILTGVVH